jgi:AcrR family transcriptional regulator
MSSNMGMSSLVAPASSSGASQGRPYGGENLADRIARRRQQFMDAGLHIFGTTGYRSATVRMLCKQAELTDRYFYESFGTTEDLLIAVYEQQFTLLQQAVMQQLLGAQADADLQDTVNAGLNTLFDMASQPCVARVCWLEVLGVSPRVDETYARTFNGFAQMVTLFARQRHPQWQIDDAEAHAVGLALIGAVSQTVTHWVLGHYTQDRQTLIAANARVFRGVLTTMGDGLA